MNILKHDMIYKPLIKNSNFPKMVSYVSYVNYINKSIAKYQKFNNLFSYMGDINLRKNSI